jgi:hypothetical protein
MATNFSAQVLCLVHVIALKNGQNTTRDSCQPKGPQVGNCRGLSCGRFTPSTTTFSAQALCFRHRRCGRFPPQDGSKAAQMTPESEHLASPGAVLAVWLFWAKTHQVANTAKHDACAENLAWPCRGPKCFRSGFKANLRLQQQLFCTGAGFQAHYHQLFCTGAVFGACQMV